MLKQQEEMAVASNEAPRLGEIWRVLLIEDKEDDYVLLREMLAKAKGRKMQMTWAPGFWAGWQALQQASFDAVLVSDELGARSGLELTQQLNASGYPAPVIVFAAQGSYEGDLEAMQAGASLYLTKQEVNPQLLERSIRYAIERKQIETELRRARRELEAQMGERASDLDQLKQELTSVNGQLSQAHRFFERELVERTRGEQALRQLEWLLAREKREDANRGEGTERESFQQPYGNPAELNEMRQVLDAVGEGVLADILSDFLDLLDTSAAVYEKNGDYALSTFTSGWCRYLNAASRDLCETDDNRAALEGGKWLCHESCWKRAALPAIESGEPQDILCSGGLHVHARPVFSDQEVVGSIKLAYGSPPNDPEKLKEIAEQYRVPVEELMRLAEEYEARTPLVIELARKRLEVSARLIGALVERRQADDAQKQALAALRENEAELKQLLVAVERSNRELEEFAFVASHDLQEPLRKIQAFGDRLLERAEGRLEESDRDYLLRMRNAAARMQEMIGGLLTLSRVTSQGQPFEPVDLNQVVKEAVSDLEMRVHSTSGQVIVEDLPVLQGDPLQLRQLMQNLISNGLKYHREGVAPVVRISYQEAELPEQGRRAALLVEDNGIGFEESNAEVIFQPFRRLHGRNQYEGTGMGLAICRKIAERHGWKISANSQPGRGSIFKIMMEA